MASKTNGWLRQRMRADGMTWLRCYQRLRARDGKMVENFLRLGLVAEIGDEPAGLETGRRAWPGREVHNAKTFW